MIGRFSLLLHFLAALFKLRERIAAEDAALRQQLIVFARWVPSEVPPPHEHRPADLPPVLSLSGGCFHFVMLGQGTSL